MSKNSYYTAPWPLKSLTNHYEYLTYLNFTSALASPSAGWRIPAACGGVSERNKKYIQRIED